MEWVVGPGLQEAWVGVGEGREDMAGDEAERDPVVSAVTHLLSAYCIPCPGLGTMGNKTKALPSWSSHSSGEADGKTDEPSFNK